MPQLRNSGSLIDLMKSYVTLGFLNGLAQFASEIVLKSRIVSVAHGEAAVKRVTNTYKSARENSSLGGLKRSFVSVAPAAGANGEVPRNADHGEGKDKGDAQELNERINSLFSHFWGANSYFFCCTVSGCSVWICRLWFVYVVQSGYFQQVRE